MRFKLHIDLGNEAMLTPMDVAEALARVASKLTHMSSFDAGGDRGTIMDSNGNAVGTWLAGQEAVYRRR